ncbi:MAG: hypothetical protein NDI67_14040 [Sulfuritalea sp.]|nr:hypothetical protein [Sulfuritalea sp.]
MATPPRKKPAKPSKRDPAANPPPPPQTVCRRCGTPGPVDDDGFCDKCERALEQACL